MTIEEHGGGLMSERCRKQDRNGKSHKKQERIVRFPHRRRRKRPYAAKEILVEFVLELKGNYISSGIGSR